jgi:hypothetical protein
MGIKFNRDYEEISRELTEAVYNIDNFYTFFDMNQFDFNALTEDEKMDCAKTLADDLFYGLFTDNKIEIGSGMAEYDNEKHAITISDGKEYKKIIDLI